MRDSVGVGISFAFKFNRCLIGYTADLCDHGVNGFLMSASCIGTDEGRLCAAVVVRPAPRGFAVKMGICKVVGDGLIGEVVIGEGRGVSEMNGNLFVVKTAFLRFYLSGIIKRNIKTVCQIT